MIRVNLVLGFVLSFASIWATQVASAADDGFLGSKVVVRSDLKTTARPSPIGPDLVDAIFIGKDIGNAPRLYRMCQLAIFDVPRGQPMVVKAGTEFIVDKVEAPGPDFIFRLTLNGGKGQVFCSGNGTMEVDRNIIRASLPDLEIVRPNLNAADQAPHGWTAGNR